MQDGTTNPRPSAHEIETAAATLRDGGLVIFPTETVYGLGADATNPDAIAAIYRLKGRPAHNPLIVHVADMAAAEQLGEFTPLARSAAQAFWPGPLTLIVAKRAEAPIAPAVTAGLSSIAIRVPAHPVGHAFLHNAAVPVAAPSANPSGRLSPTRSSDLIAELSEQVAHVLDAGPSQHGLESTVIDVTGSSPSLLRPGAITAAEVAERTGQPVSTPQATSTERPSSPGMLLRHYAPLTPIRLNAAAADPDEVLLAFGPTPTGTTCFTLNLSNNGELTEAAANLYHMLHVLDGRHARSIAIMPIPNHGLGEVINERLTRAAAAHKQPLR